MTKKHEEVLHLEAHPKSVKRALKAVEHGFGVVDVHASVKENGEHGRTTLVFTHTLDAADAALAVQAVGKQANIEEDHLLRADDDSEDAA